MEEVYMGSMIPTWNYNKKIKTITFNVTDDCNLACTYCYFTHKSNKHKMNFEVAKKAIDYILSDTNLLIYDGVIWDFIGGEPTLELKLIDKICEYIIMKMYYLKHKWLNCYRFMIGSNGLLYSDPLFQKIISKYSFNLNVNLTIDGSKEKHDLSRKKKDGTGSYDDIVKNIPLWQSQTGGITTKATFAHADLPYLKDSIINLWNLGIKNVMANVVFEDVWCENDDMIFEEQLKALADYIINNKLWNKYSVRFFSPNMGFPAEDKSYRINLCGSGNMLAIDTKGNFYPCMRFADSALNKQKSRNIGNIEVGLDYDKIRAFNVLDGYSQSNQTCLECEISNGCGWCTGFNYDENGTIFKRTTYQCLMHKANVRACKYFWNKYEDITGKISPRRYNEYKNESKIHKYMNIICDSSISYCKYNASSDSTMIDKDLLKRAVKYCDDNSITPVFIGSHEKKYYGFYINPYYYFDDKDEFDFDIINSNEKIDYNNHSIANNIIYRLYKNDLKCFHKQLIELIENNGIENINICLLDFDLLDETDLKLYYDNLRNIADYLAHLWKNKQYININAISGGLFRNSLLSCSAGINTVTLGPNGKIYMCAADYNESNPEIGILGEELIYNKERFNVEKSPLCKSCTCYSCFNCVYLNKKMTDEYLAPAEIQCVLSNLERKVSYYFSNLIKGLELPFDINNIKQAENLDTLLDLKKAKSFARKGLQEKVLKLLNE